MRLISTLVTNPNRPLLFLFFFSKILLNNSVAINIIILLSVVRLLTLFSCKTSILDQSLRLTSRCGEWFAFQHAFWKYAYSKHACCEQMWIAEEHACFRHAYKHACFRACVSVPLHPLTVTAWCAVHDGGVIHFSSRTPLAKRQQWTVRAVGPCWPSFFCRN